jgi:CTP synthase (UTP-ammonia lyase)
VIAQVVCYDPHQENAMGGATSRVGVIGDWNAKNRTHRFTNDALDHLGLTFEWVPTESIGPEPATRLEGYDGLFIAPASPYRSMEGALSAIRHARERGVPLVGT